MVACSDDQMVGQYGERVAENDEIIPPAQPPLLQRQMLGTQKTTPGADRRGVDLRCSAYKTLRIVLCDHLRAVDLQRPILRGRQRHCAGAQHRPRLVLLRQEGRHTRLQARPGTGRDIGRQRGIAEEARDPAHAPPALAALRRCRARISSVRRRSLYRS